MSFSYLILCAKLCILSGPTKWFVYSSHRLSTEKYLVEIDLNIVDICINFPDNVFY